MNRSTQFPGPSLPIGYLRENKQQNPFYFHYCIYLEVNGAFGVGVWKEILKENDWCWENMAFTVGNGTKIRFWTDLWCGCTVLSQRFPHLYAMAAHRNAMVEEIWDRFKVYEGL